MKQGSNEMLVKLKKVEVEGGGEYRKSNFCRGVDI